MSRHVFGVDWAVADDRATFTVFDVDQKRIVELVHLPAVNYAHQ